jgi:Tfp pilus assembly protein PilO
MPRILISIILFALTILIAVFLLWPGYLKFQNLQAQTKNKELEFQYKDQYYKDLSSLSEKLNGYKDELAKIDSALPSYPSIPAFYNFIQKISSENGLVLNSIGSFSTSQLTESLQIKETTVGPFNLSGSYSSFKNFLTSLEKNSRIVSVEKISLSPPLSLEESPERLFNFGVTMKIYSY